MELTTVHPVVILIFLFAAIVIFICGQHCGYQDGYDDGEKDTYELWAYRITQRHIEDNYIESNLELTRRSFDPQDLVPKRKRKPRRKKHRAYADMNKYERLVYYFGDILYIDPAEWKPKKWTKKAIHEICKQIESELKAKGEWADCDTYERM